MDHPSDSKAQSLTRSERINIRIAATQTVLAIVGIFIGSVALYAALGESEAVRKQTEASVWPRVDVVSAYYGIAGEERVEIIARNRGIGPAVVKSVIVAVDGEPQKNWFDVIRALSPGDRPSISNQEIDKAVISPNEDVRLLSLEEKYSSKAQTLAVRDAFIAKRLSVEICYCSVFDSCWETRSKDGAPKEVKECLAGALTEF